MRLPCFVGLLTLAACAATSNPDPVSVEPAVPPAPAGAASAGASAPASAPQEPRAEPPGKATAPAQQPDPAPAQEPDPAPAAGGTPPASAEGAGSRDAGPGQPADGAPDAPEPVPLGVALVGGDPIDVRDFLSQLWMRDAQRARELLDYLVFSHIALLEADRLGVRVDPALADATVDRAWEALKKRLADSGSKLTLEQHIGRTLEMDVDSYGRKLRNDAIVQLVSERVVRAWYLSNPRVELRLTELADDKALAAAQAALAAGKPFEDVARENGCDVDAAKGGTTMTVVRSEASELARLAFSTPVGEIGGPLVQGGHFLLVRPEKRLEAIEGDWSQVGQAVEQSLKDTPIDSDRLEYAQWRTAMMRRYPIDLTPFLDLVGASAP